MPAPGLTISDYTVLGIVSRDGPCTAYAVMCSMAASPSSFYRKRASSTYASVQKLVKRRLLEAAAEDPGPRGERLLSITHPGQEALHAWLLAIPASEATHSNDLIRLRVNFARTLSPEERRELVERSQAMLEAHLKKCELELPARKDPLSRLTLRGLIHETRARLAWLEEVEKWLKEEN